MFFVILMMISVASSALLVFRYINRNRPDVIKKSEIEPMNATDSTYVIPEEDESDDENEIFNQIKSQAIAAKVGGGNCKSEDLVNGAFSI